MSCRVLWVGFVLTAIFSCAAEHTYAQDHLIPGAKFERTDYDRAVKTLFAEAFEPNVKLSTLTEWAFGGESMLGLKTQLDGYQLFLLEPQFVALEHVGQYYDSCIQQLGFPISVSMGRLCTRSNYDDIDTLTMRRVVVDISPAAANIMMSLWSEMLYRSRFSRDYTLITDGIVYTFAANIDTGKKFIAHTHSPYEGYLSEVTNSVRAIMSAMRDDDEAVTDSVISATTDGFLKVYQKLMSDDDAKDLISSHGPSLKACDFSIMDRFPSDFCWQTQLMSDGRTNLLVANKHNDTYKYELMLLDGDDIIKRVDIIPVIDHYSVFRTISASSTYGYSVLYPWEIKDINTMAQDGQVRLFGYFEDFKLIDSHFGIESAQAIILFEALLPYVLKRSFIEVEGKTHRFSIDQLFRTD